MRAVTLPGGGPFVLGDGLFWAMGKILVAPAGLEPARRSRGNGF